MNNQQAIDEINRILDKVYILEITPVDGINRISKVLAEITPE
jgi:hypothetical protein